MSLVRRVLNIYRSFQYALFGRAKYGVMQPGRACKIELFKSEENHEDVVHPCVRYIPGGYEGHCWWLVYTPYYGADPGMENPILCYAESNDPIPPIEWKVYCEVNPKPARGYNSDPTLLYTNGRLYVFWREYGTPSCEESGHEVATFGGIVEKGGICDRFGPVVWSNDAEVDAEVSPTFDEKDGGYECLAMHLKFHSKTVKSLPVYIKTIANKFFSVTDLIGIFSQQKSYGIAIWKSDKIEKPFTYMETVKFEKCNRLYRPWHMDIFQYEGISYAIVQTNQCNADLCLAWSEDGCTYTFYNKPLITNATIGKLGIYKPCAGVLHDGLFYLYYTAQNPENRLLNKLYLTKIPFSELYSLIQQS